jgi:imidazolonepropionase-like amidohydrolase
VNTRRLLATSLTIAACGRADGAAPERPQQARALVVRHATVLDTRTSKTLPDRAIVMRGDRIAQVVADSAYRSSRDTQQLDARGRLVVPGLIDVHHHSAYVFPDSITPGGGAVSQLVMRPDSIAVYRSRWASAYLPYGVTVAREVGGDERYLALMTAWMIPSPNAPDFIPSGGALVSAEHGRVPFTGHAVVRDSADAAARVRRYHDAGIRDIKLYWRLREPEYVGAFTEARRLGMHVTTHIDFGVLSIRRALAIGVRHFEHAYTLGVEVISASDAQAAWTRTRQELGADPPAGVYWGVLEHFNTLGPRNAALGALIADLAKAHATVTPTLHIFAQRAGLAPYATKPLGTFDNSDAWTPAQRARARRGYEILAQYVRQLHDAGVTLAVGTDWLDPGQVALSEMILLHRAGIPMADVLSIATLGGARVMEREADYGTIEPGRKAQLVIFDRSPLEDPEAVLAGKTVIKDGVVVPPSR